MALSVDGRHFEPSVAARALELFRDLFAAGGVA
jgi:hypothetical protein